MSDDARRVGMQEELTLCKKHQEWPPSLMSPSDRRITVISVCAFTTIALGHLGFTLRIEWKESIIIPVHKKDYKMDCNKYKEISLLSTS